MNYLHVLALEFLFSEWKILEGNFIAKRNVATGVLIAEIYF